MYGWHVNRYERWWVQYQARQTASIAGWTLIPAFPITTAKVSMFLEYEANCEKVQWHLVQIYDRYVDNIMTLYRLRRPSGRPPDCTQYMCYIGQLNGIQ